MPKVTSVLELDSSHRMTEVSIIPSIWRTRSGRGPVRRRHPERYRRRVAQLRRLRTAQNFGPLFRPTTPEEFKTLSRELIANGSTMSRSSLREEISDGRQFHRADSYLYTVLLVARVGVDLSGSQHHGLRGTHAARRKCRSAQAEAWRKSAAIESCTVKSCRSAETPDPRS